MARHEGASAGRRGFLKGVAATSVYVTAVGSLLGCRNGSRDAAGATSAAQSTVGRSWT